MINGFKVMQFLSTIGILTLVYMLVKLLIYIVGSKIGLFIIGIFVGFIIIFIIFTLVIPKGVRT